MRTLYEVVAVFFLTAFMTVQTALAARVVGIEASQTQVGDSGYSFMDRVEEAVEPLRSLEYSGIAGVGSSGFQGSFVVGYLMGPYVLIETTPFYSKEFSRSIGYNLRSGINSDLTLRLGKRNGLIVPFGGTGVGFERWDQYLESDVNDGETLRDDNATVSQFVGLAIRMGSNMQLKMTSRWLTWLDNPPYDLTKRLEARLPRREKRLDLGLAVIF